MTTVSFRLNLEFRLLYLTTIWGDSFSFQENEEASNKNKTYTRKTTIYQNGLP